MSDSPVTDFQDSYADCGAARFHMPGHKGKGDFFKYDITEIDGAGDLFSDEGIVAESESAASELFGCRTYYSTEGSSLAIRTMLALECRAKRGRVIAARNAHRSFISAAILLDLDVVWIGEGATYLSCSITPDDVESSIENNEDTTICVYVTSPDYLGNILDVKGIAAVCRKYGVDLLVDNAHGAYLKFLNESLHPIDLGAAMCADSAHKTLPVLTGGAYLHLSPDAGKKYGSIVKETMKIFASSSPSYLILRSLDSANRELSDYSERLSALMREVDKLKIAVSSHGFDLTGDEGIKMTVAPKSFGYTGDEIASILAQQKIVPEFHDPDYVTFMFTPENTNEELSRLCKALCSVSHREAITALPPRTSHPVVAMSPREAFFSATETVTVESAAGRVLSCDCASCPPAVPIVVPGEVIDGDAVEALRYYGIENVTVIK